MARTIGAPLAAHLASGRTKLARCLRLDLRDGTSIGITDHDVDLDVDLGDGVLTYQAETGALPSAVSLSLGLAADSFEVRGPIAALVTRAGLLGGRFDRATARLFDVRWDQTAQLMALIKGKVTAARAEAGVFVFEVRGHADAFNQTIGRVLSPYCSADLGDARCGVVLGPHTYAATVSAVTDELTFTAAFGGSPPSADRARAGKVTFLTGALAGTLPVEVFSLAAGVVTLFAPLAAPPQVGDTLEMVRGCPKIRTACRDEFANMVNFRGFPDVPGNNEVLKFPIPGTSA